MAPAVQGALLPVVPFIIGFIIDEGRKVLYHRGLTERDRKRGWLRDTCLTAQDSFKAWLDYFKIPYEEQ